MNEAIESTLIYRSFYNAYQVMPPDERNLLMDAILAYSFDGIETDFTSHPWAQSVFEAVRPNIDSRNASVMAGKSGGRPKKETLASETPERAVFENAKGGVSGNEKGGFENSETKAKAKAEAKVNIKEADASCPERCSDPPADVEAIPLNDGSEWRPTVSELSEYERLYPGVNVKQELANMRGWCQGNPTRRKTKTGVKRFVAAWLSKEQNRAHGRDAPKPKNGFNRFDQRTYNNDELEAMLLGGAP